MADIFVSYSSTDKERVRPLVEKLQTAGYSIWWDSQLRGGSLFAKEIEAELKNAKAVLTVWTVDSLESRWVADEAELALRSEKLVPIRLDDVEAPIGFRQVQTIDFVKWDGQATSPVMQTLTKAIAHNVGALDAAADKSDLDFSLPERPSIAILPFQSLGADSGQEFLAEGIRFGVQATMVQLSGLFLVNASVLNSYRESDVSAANAGAELGVRYVLDGAVQQAGNQVRVTVQLTDVKTKQTIWADRYDRIVDDVFALQDEITREVISSLNIKLHGSELGRVWFAELTSPEASEYYYRGSSYLYEGSPKDNAAARDMFENLYRVQPDTVTGPSNIAVTHWFDGFMGWTDTPDDSMKLAEEWALKAMEYEQNNGIGHAVYGHIQLQKGKHDEALEACTTGVNLRNSCPLAHGLLGLVHNYQGNSDLAIQSAKQALQLEKIYPSWLVNVLAVAYRDGGNVEHSIPVARESLRVDPQQHEAQIILCSDYNITSDNDNAKRVAGEIMAKDPSFRLSTYAKSQPYRDPAALDDLINSLRAAGLPE